LYLSYGIKIFKMLIFLFFFYNFNILEIINFLIF